MIDKCVQTLAGVVLDRDMFHALQLPWNPPDPKKPLLVTGPTSTRDIAAAAFLTSHAAANTLGRSISPALIHALCTCNDAGDVKKVWPASCPPAKVVALSASCCNNTASQSKTDDRRNSQSGSTPHTLRRQHTKQAFRSSMSLPVAKPA